MRRSDGAVLLTGATGFVGMELLARYLERTERPVLTIVRAGSDEAARERIDAVLENLFGYHGARYADRVTAVAGDLTAPRLGLDQIHWDWLAAESTMIVHCAASVSFGLSLEEARAINVEGTRRMLELAGRAQELGVLQRYAQVSTAYVAGTHAGPFYECDLDVGQSFNNSYEQSKFESEQLVRSRPGLPFTILRPSIVVGDSNSGWTAAFNVLYWPLRALARGLFPAVPAVASAPVDVVSIDYVADGIYELCESAGGIRQTYHLTAGADASTIGEIAELASGYFQQPVPRLLPPAEFMSADHGVARSMLEEGAMYFPYFSVATTFDDALARAQLQQAGISVSPLRDYMSRLLDYATRAHWGKSPMARVEAAWVLAGVLVPFPPTWGVGPCPWVARGRGREQSRWLVMLADTARFRTDDPDALVIASLACPICLCSDDIEWHAALDGYDPSVECRCPRCEESWRVYLEPQQALRFALMDSL